MKNRSFLKTVLCIAAAMLLFTGVNAQVENGDYVRYDTDTQIPDTIDYVTLKTGGTTMGYYALPDPVYHPNYNSGGGWALNTGFTWNWTAPVNPGTAPVFGGGTPANYVEITYTVTGDYEINVAEEAPASFGGCADATPTVMNVTVIDPPVVVITTDDPDQACGDQVAATVNVTFTEAVPVDWAGYAFAINQLIENIDADDNVVGSAIVDADTLNFATIAKLNSSNGLTGAASPYGYSFNTRELEVLNGQRTRYTYTLVKASDAPAAAADGLISAISQKSDYLAATVNTYPFGTKSTFVAIVNPAPETGPIYYVPNDFNY